MARLSDLYDFVFRGLLTEEALDRAGRKSPHLAGYLDSDLVDALSIDVLDVEFVSPARQMATVYAAISAFENSARRLVSSVLIDAHGDEWWERVSEPIRKKAEARREDEKVTKWHAARGESLINYTELGDLAKVMGTNWELFEPHVRSQEWTKAIFGTIERSRNVIMHSGNLEIEDIERLGMHIRDWVKQVGA